MPFLNILIENKYMASNAKLGEIVLVIAVSIFLYYFFWVAILPFMLIDEGKLVNRNLNNTKILY